MDGLCPEQLQRSARNHTRRLVPPTLAHLREDIAADAIVRVLERVSQGHPLSHAGWRWAVIDALRAERGGHRTRAGRARASARYVDADALTTENAVGELEWCVARLREAWPTLTDQQRSSVTHWLLDEVTPGMHPSVACRSRAAAFERVRAHGAAC